MSKASDYAVEAALQQCFDALGDAVKMQMAKRSRCPAFDTGSSGNGTTITTNTRPEKIVLSSPFVPKVTCKQPTRKDFAVMLGLEESADMDQPCDDISEFFYFMLLSNRSNLLENLNLTTNQKILLELCKKNI